MSRTMPKQKPGKSETIVRTPPELLTAVKNLLGIDEFYRDLAASHGNNVAEVYYTVEEDGLARAWKTPQNGCEEAWNWLNPPYDKIAPWVRKAAHVLNRAGQRGQTAMLVPASVGANWWRDYAHKKASVRFLNGRPIFLDKMGKPICSKKTGKPTPYPKDLALLLYGLEPGYDIWDWRRS